MKIELTKKLDKPTMILGFPGFGLVGTIATEFLLKHLKVEKVGTIWLEEMAVVAAIHENTLIHPLALYYNNKYNLLLAHGVTAVQGIEWKIADAIMEVANKCKVKEIISIEGIGNSEDSVSMNTYYFSTSKLFTSKLDKNNVKKLNEGIILGISGALLIKANKLKLSCIFTETHSKLPDSKAAAKTIEVLDKILNLKVDYKPLLKQAEEFEDKLKGLMQQSATATRMANEKNLSYVG